MRKVDVELRVCETHYYIIFRKKWKIIVKDGKINIYTILYSMGVMNIDDNNILIKKCFNSYLLPSIIAILGGNISITIDNIIAGRYIGGDALAAMSMLNPVFYLFTTVGTLLCAGSSTIASVLIGKGKTEKINNYFTYAALSSLVSGIVLTIVLLLLQNLIYSFMGADGHMLELMKQYGNAFIPGGIFVVGVYFPLNYLRIDGKGRLGMRMFLIMAGVDIILDLLFVIKFGLGMFGLALATVISSAVAIIVVMPFLIGKNSTFKIVKLKIIEIKRMSRATFITGSPLAMNNLYSVIRTICLNLILIAAGGSVGVACYAFAIGIYTIANAVISGTAQTISPLIGVFRGEKDSISIRKTMKIALINGTVMIVVYIAIISVCCKPLCSLFGIEDNMEKQAIIALILCSVSLIGTMLNSVYMYYYMTISRTRLANHITLARGLVFQVICTFILSKIWGLVGVWIGFSVSEILTYILIIIETRIVRKKDEELKDMLLLRDSKGKLLSFSINTSKEDVASAAEKVGIFCEECELSPKQSMMISLSIEEILTLMIEHVFPDNKDETIDSRIYVEGEEILLRFRCRGRRFNPIEYYNWKAKSGDLDEIGDCMGLMMIKKAAKDIKYTTNLGLNNMIVNI